MKNLIVNLLAIVALCLAMSGCEEKNEPQSTEFCGRVKVLDFQKVAEITNEFLVTINNSLSDDAKIDNLKNWLLGHPCVQDVEIFCVSCIYTLPPISELSITFKVNGQLLVKIMDVLMSEPMQCGFHSDEDTGKVKVIYTNNTGVDILDVVANEKRIGTFRKGETTGAIFYDSFGADTGMPDIAFTGIIDGETIESTNRFFWCGTEKTTIKEGILEISVNLIDGPEGKKYFSLSFTKVNVPSPLTNKTWKLTAISSGPEKPVIVDNYAIVFKEDGTVEFPLNCNISGGNYIVNPNSFIAIYGSISFSGFYPGTDRACSGLSNLEDFVVNKLLKARMYSARGNNLTIECEDYTYLYFETSST